MIETRYAYPAIQGTVPPVPEKRGVRIANIAVETDTLEVMAFWQGYRPMTSKELREQYDQANNARPHMENGWIAYFSELGSGDEDRLRKKLGADMVEIFGPGGGSLWFIHPRRKRLAEKWLVEAKNVCWRFATLVPIGTGGPSETQIPNGWYDGWFCVGSVFLSDQPL